MLSAAFMVRCRNSFVMRNMNFVPDNGTKQHILQKQTHSKGNRTCEENGKKHFFPDRLIQNQECF